MLAESREKTGLAAACLLSALGTKHETDKEAVRAHVGAILLAEALDDLKIMRKVWTK